MSQQGIEIIGWVGAIITSICFLPQVIKVLVTKSTKDLSLIMTLCLLTANCVWITFGVLNHNPQVWATNVCQIVLIFGITGYKIYNIATQKEKLKWSFKTKTKNETSSE